MIPEEWIKSDKMTVSGLKSGIRIFTRMKKQAYFELKAWVWTRAHESMTIHAIKQMASTKGWLPEEEDDFSSVFYHLAAWEEEERTGVPY